MTERSTTYSLWRVIVVLAASGLVGAPALAIPLTFQFQGHVQIDEVAYEGEGFFKFALLDEHSEVIWSNDGSLGSDVVPVASVSLTLDRGLYSVALGDTDLANMVAIEPSVFDSNALTLRVWFSSDDSDYSQLEPDTVLGSVAFAVRVAKADTVASLPAGIIERQHLSTNLDKVFDRFPALSTDDEDSELIDAGYVPILASEHVGWIDGDTADAPAARAGHVSAWTGSEFLVWGGYGGSYRFFKGGSAYRVDVDEWASISPVGAPPARRGSSGLWTGDSLLIWGGEDLAGTIDGGSRFVLSSNSWNPISSFNEPSTRVGHVGVWTGASMVIWGGRDERGHVEDAGIYDPETDEWTTLEFANLRPLDPVTATFLSQVVDGSEGSNASNWRNGIDEDPPFLDNPQRVVVADGRAFVTTSRDDSLSIFDVTDPTQPDLKYSLLHVARQSGGPSFRSSGVYAIDFMNAPSGIAVNGDYLYVGSGSSSALSVFSISSSHRLTRLAVIEDSGSSGNFRYFDRPIRVGVYDDLCVVGIQGVDGSSSPGVYLLDVSTPSSPSFLSRIIDGAEITTTSGGTAVVDLDLGVVDVDVHGDLVAFCSSGGGGVYLVDISDRADPRLVSHLVDDNGGFDFLSAPEIPRFSDEGNLLMVSSDGDDDAITFIDVSEPSQASSLAVIQDGVNGFDLLADPGAMATQGNLLVIPSATDSAVSIVDFTIPSDPMLLTTFANGDGGATAMSSPNAVAISDGVLYVTSPGSDDALTILEMNLPEPPAARVDASGVWTGDSLLVWGGEGDGLLGDGFRIGFDVDRRTAQTWETITEVDAPEVRREQSTVWTGSEMIIWGGRAGAEFLSAGARFNPVTSTWTPIPTDESRAGRAGHAAVWTGSEMLILGGYDGSGERGDGYAYDPSSDTWRELSTEGDPIARRDATVVWTGEEALVFGGISEGRPVGRLQRLDPEPRITFYRKK